MHRIRVSDTMPTISINPYYFVELGNMPFPLMLARLFLDGGWIPVLLVLVNGFWIMWVQSRQAKYAATVAHTLLAINIPRENEQTPKAAEQIFSNISGAYSGFDKYEKYWLGKFNPTFSFELVSIGGYIQYFVHCPKKFRDLVESAIYAQYPEAEVNEVPDYADKIPTVYPHPEVDAFGTEFVLKKPSAYPIRMYEEFEDKSAETLLFKDPMSPMLEVLASIKPGEQMWIQWLVTPTDDGWQKKAEEVVDKIMGKKKVVAKGVMEQILEIPLAAATELTTWGEAGAVPEKKPEQPKMASMSPGEKKVLEAIQHKMSKIGLNVKIRVVYSGRRDIFSKGRFTALKGAMNLFSMLSMNAFKGYGPVTPKGDYFWQRWTEQEKKTRIVRNYRNRSNKGATPFVLNIEELATIYHFPIKDVKAPLIKKTEAKRAEPPSSLPTEDRYPSMPIAAPRPKPKKGGEYSDEETPDNLPFA